MATQFARASYTEVIDLQTTNGNTSVIGIHTPVGKQPYQKLSGFFNQFRKYKYKGISSLIMVPAANLPVDPLGLTGVTGTTDLMDPRDALNPILFHGCHGENLSRILNTIYSSDERTNSLGANLSDDSNNVSDSAYEKLIANNNIGDYYRCLTDTSWKKYGIQSGVKLKGLHPLVHKMARNAPVIPGLSANAYDQNTGLMVEEKADTTTGITTTNPAFPTNYGLSTDAFTPINEVGNVNDSFPSTGDAAVNTQYVQEFTNGMTRLGWLPTTKILSDKSLTGNIGAMGSTIVSLPKLYMGVLIMPPSYNIEQFFRMVIRHEFEFAEFTTSLGAKADAMQGTISGVGGSTYYNWIDYGDKKPEPKPDIKEGETIDMIGGESHVISDGVA